MAYLKEFLKRIDQRDFQKFISLWKEYCHSDSIDVPELTQLLETIKTSDFAKSFGEHLELGLPLLALVTDENDAYQVLKLFVDLQTTQSSALAEIATKALEKKYGNDPKFNERLRLVGLRNKDNFQGALSKYDLIAHFSKGNAVFHTGGWGTGEIVEVSFVREHILVEFENVGGRKDISFINAFKTLVPLSNQHFLARRFLNPDLLEQEGKKDPVFLIKLLLRDLGSKTAGEIKDELCGLVIPDKEWVKWWQLARQKLKKDHHVHVPESLKEPFFIRQEGRSQQDRLLDSLQNSSNALSKVQDIYAAVRDNPNELKNQEFKNQLLDTLKEILDTPDLPEAQIFQILILMEQYFNYQPSNCSIAEKIKKNDQINLLIDEIDIIAFKKRALIAIKENRQDWVDLFLDLLYTVNQSQLRDFILKELSHNDTRARLVKKLDQLLHHPTLSPETFIWYFQKLLTKGDVNLPHNNDEGRGLFLDAFFVLYHKIENLTEYRELVKKMYALLSGERYAIVRQILKGKSLEFIKEFLLLASKCQTLSELDQKTLRSLAEVVHPQLAQSKPKKGSVDVEEENIWTTEEGYQKVKERIQQIGTIEMIENAREIEAARALGDLRENSEFKFAQEKRARLQAELKNLSDQLNQARVITPDDVHPTEVGVGCKVDVCDPAGMKISYSILGPWDADPEKNILSFNSKLALTMKGKKKGERFEFKDGVYTVVNIDTLFPQ